MIGELLPKSFYQGGDVVSLAEQLLGCYLATEIDGVFTSGKIVETEAYRGRDDKGCHSYIHGLTDRTKVMYDQGGLAYVYVCYGMHHMVNVVTNTDGQADAVLIRAIEPVIGLNSMLDRRGGDFKYYHLAGGPGKVCQCLGITKVQYGQPYYDETSQIKIFNRSEVPTIISTPRVGMSSRVAEYANMPWRFYEKDNPYISRPLHLEYDYES